MTTLTLSEEIYKKCLNKEKLCFGLPDGCIQSKSCAILSSSFPNISKVTFELLAPIESNRQNYYIAYSVSKISVNMRCKRIYGTRNLISNFLFPSKSMGGSVVQCYLDSNPLPQIGLSFNKYNSHKNDLVENITGIELISAVYKDGTLHCVWNRDLNTQVNGETFDLVNNRYYIQLAKGGMKEKSMKIKL